MTQRPGPFTAVADHVYVSLVPFSAEDGPAEAAQCLRHDEHPLPCHVEGAVDAGQGGMVEGADQVVVDLGAIRHNVRRLRELVTEDGSTGPQLMVVVKADAYGHGMLPVARAARPRHCCCRCPSG